MEELLRVLLLELQLSARQPNVVQNSPLELAHSEFPLTVLVLLTGSVEQLRVLYKGVQESLKLFLGLLELSAAKERNGVVVATEEVFPSFELCHQKLEFVLGEEKGNQSFQGVYFLVFQESLGEKKGVFVQTELVGNLDVLQNLQLELVLH